MESGLKVPPMTSSLSTRVSLIAIVAALYTVGKGITGFVPSPWGVGQLLIGIFLPALFAVVAETWPVAVGAALGTFIGDVLILTPLGETNPLLSLLAGVPANFIAFLLFGMFVKRYNSWSGFIAATVSFVTLGNLIAAIGVVEVLGFPLSFISAFTVFWDMTAIPSIIIAVPILVRMLLPLKGRSRIIQYFPDWSGVSRRDTVISVAFALAFAVVGLIFIATNPTTTATYLGIGTYFSLAAAIVLILAPVMGIVLGSRPSGKIAK